jgi:hypothetical protein
MKIGDFLNGALHPEPSERSDTSLRYTDILFGFVIKELFIRLQYWGERDWQVRLHLLVGTVLVLGSWIGYRRSANRPAYEVKFFNLPLVSFVLDQLMLIAYFHVATLTDPTAKPANPSLVYQTEVSVFFVLLLYLPWDLIALWMGHSYRYPNAKPDIAGITITSTTLVVMADIQLPLSRLSPDAPLVSTVILLLGYRFAKEIRTTWRLLSSRKPSTSIQTI